MLFLLCIGSLSEAFQNCDLEKPILLDGAKITSLFFADDCAIFARCEADAKTLAKAILKWSEENGIPLNLGKCRSLCNAKCDFVPPSPFLKCDSYNYLGVLLSLSDDGNVVLSRNPHKSLLLAHKLSPGSQRIPDCETLRDIIRSFHMGPYALHICLANEIAAARAPIELSRNLFRYDKFMIKIVADYCGLSHTKLSLNRISSELRLAQARCGPALIRYASDFYCYLSELPLSSAESVTVSAIHSNSVSFKKLAYCHSVLKPQLPKTKMCPIPETHWLNAPKYIRKVVAEIFLGTDHDKFRPKAETLRGLIANKLFMEAKSLALAIMNS